MAEAEATPIIRAIPLPANSFEFGELEKALEHATGVQDQDKHPERIQKAILETAVHRDVLEAAAAPALPEGTKMAIVEGADGRKVEAPVSIAADAKSGEEAAAQLPPAGTGGGADTGGATTGDASGATGTTQTAATGGSKSK